MSNLLSLSYYFLMLQMNIPIIIIIIAVIAMMGENTHIHDQLITPVNFRAINSIVNAPINPIPLLFVCFILFYIIYNFDNVFICY